MPKYGHKNGSRPIRGQEKVNNTHVNREGVLGGLERVFGGGEQK